MVYNIAPILALKRTLSAPCLQGFAKKKNNEGDALHPERPCGSYTELTMSPYINYKATQQPLIIGHLGLFCQGRSGDPGNR